MSFVSNNKKEVIFLLHIITYQYLWTIIGFWGTRRRPFFAFPNLTTEPYGGRHASVTTVVKCFDSLDHSILHVCGQNDDCRKKIGVCPFGNEDKT